MVHRKLELNPVVSSAAICLVLLVAAGCTGCGGEDQDRAIACPGPDCRPEAFSMAIVADPHITGSQDHEDRLLASPPRPIE